MSWASEVVQANVEAVLARPLLQCLRPGSDPVLGRLPDADERQVHADAALGGLEGSLSVVGPLDVLLVDMLLPVRCKPSDIPKLVMLLPGSGKGSLLASFPRATWGGSTLPLFKSVV
mmetsp:Transcript_68485/g.194040  ORF Transcript_68485/g.194040 Transcript_68485/m.194040 type:complete len:117 (+) Transcript_68485:175-525(+)